MAMTNTTTDKSFFSLKWKVAILFGGLLLVINASFPALVYWNLNQEFTFSREQIQQQFAQELRGQIETSSIRLQQLAEFSLIPTDDKKNGSISNNINILLNKHKSLLELDWNVSQAQIFNNSSEILGGWGNPITPPFIHKLILSVIKNEQPVNTINCSDSCKQFVLIPILSSDAPTSVLVLAHDLSNLLLDFSEQTGTDLAVLSSKKNKAISIRHKLTSWEMNINALSSFDDNLPYLNTMAENHPISTINTNGGTIRDHHLPVEFKFITLDQTSDVLFVIIDNIANQRQEIIDITYRSIFIALFGVIAIGGGLFFFISSPLVRLSSVSRALPLLASQQFNVARKLILSKTSRHKNDELDLLESSAHDLATQLEELQISVNERTKTINQHSLELQQERDFIKSLIDTAQLIIITIDKDCNISSFNDFAEELTGYLEQDVLSSNISRFFPKEQWLEIEPALLELKKTPNTVNRHESELVQHDGNIRFISWLHSSLANPTDSTTILSVGLDITDKKHNEQQLIWIADHDMLTKLYNRRRFNIEFERLLASSERFNHQGTLLFLDLDQFKDINDSCGHKTGDKLLKQVAQTLLDTTRETDVVARLGGDEFAILLPETTNIGAAELAEKTCQVLGDINIRVDDINYKISASIGLITFPQAGLSADELVSNADLAMYKAKDKGKNTWYHFTFDDQAREQLESRVLWKQKIEEALANNRFIFHYQPIMDIRTRSVSHYEALLRMQNEDGSLELPGTFIGVAEQTGLIHAIDHYVLNQGLNELAELDKKNSNISLSLNLSGYATSDPLLLPLLERLLQETGTNPENLIFELTETAAVADINHAKDMMSHLNKLGCRFSLDDFGTGFSSFRYMRELPIDIVKIDGSFITNLANNPDDQLFVKALIDVAKGMGKKTVAEFVENAEILALLHAFGVDYAQGYYIGKPEPYFLDSPPILK